MRVASRDFVYVRELSAHVGERVALRGWVAGKRSSGKVRFLVLRDGSGWLQCVAFVKDLSPEIFERMDRVPLESSLRVEGTVRKDDRAPGGYELSLSDLTVVHEAAEYPVQPKEHGVEFLFDHRHLYLRSRTPHAVLRVRNEVLQACRDFFYQRHFVLIDSPILTPAACEGTSTLFETDYFDAKAYLSQSGQLYLEPAAMAFGSVYCLGPTFRAEKSKTRRHLTEFWMIEPEVAFLELAGLLELAEEFVSYVVARALDRCQEDLKFLERDLTRLTRVIPPFPRLPYDEAAEIKAFYMQPDPADPGKALCVDVLAPEGYGEIIGGSQRIHDHDLLLRRIQEHGLPVEAFQWYLDIRKYGTVPHSGFGMGIERCVTWICGIPHLREAIPYPRQIHRLYP